MKNIKNIIFDFDGVLMKNIDLMYKANKETLKNFSREDFDNSFDGNTINYYKDVSEKDLEKFYYLFNKYIENLKIDIKTKEFLEKNKDKRFYIISSNKEEILNKVLKNNNLLNNFEKILGKNTHKTKIEKFKILEKNNINLGESIFITDSLGDLKEASHFLELKKIAVTWGVHNRERLEKGSPDKIIDSWEELWL